MKNYPMFMAMFLFLMAAGAVGLGTKSPALSLATLYGGGALTCLAAFLKGRDE